MRPMGGLGRHIVGLIPTYLPEIWQHLRKAHFDWGAKMAPAADPGWGSLARAVEAVDGRYQTNYVASKATHGPHQ